MTEKFTINHNNPYFGCVTLTNPEDKVKNYAETYPSYTYYCSECARLRSLLDAEENSHAEDNVEGGRVRDHLRNKLARAENDLAVLEQMHGNQAKTIIEQAEEIKGLKERNLDPEPHALKAAILVMQKQLDELTVALNKAKKERVDCDADWRRMYKSMLDSYNHYVDECRKKIKELEEKLAAESEDACNGGECDECECDTTDQLREENRNLQRRVDEQNRQLGAKQEEINNLRVALNKAKAKQTFEVKPAAEIVRSYDDKIRRLLNVLASKDEIIAGLQNDLRGDRG
jgi:hypothetical protein